MAQLFPWKTLSAYAKVYGVPDFVKSSSVLTENDISGLPQNAFADTLRKLPVHTKAATWCSYLAHAAGDLFDPTGKAALNLEKSAEWWSIGAECRAIADNLKKQAEIAPASDADFALVEEHDGAKVRSLPMRGCGNVKQSADSLVKSAGKYPYIWRKSAARKLLKRANELSVDLGANKIALEKTAGYGYSGTAYVVRQLRQRQHVIKDAAVRERLGKIADALVDREHLAVAELEKIAETLDSADAMTGIYNHYESVLPPEEVCHSIALSTAQEKRASFIQLTNGTTLSAEDLEKMPAEKFAALGDDFVAAISGDSGNVDTEKAAELLPTLPADDANVFVRSM